MSLEAVQAVAFAWCHAGSGNCCETEVLSTLGGKMPTPMQLSSRSWIRKRRDGTEMLPRSGWKAIKRLRSRGIMRSRKSPNGGFGKSRFAHRRPCGSKILWCRFRAVRAAHIAMEEGLVFRIAEAELSEPHKRVLGRAMASRHGLRSRP